MSVDYFILFFLYSGESSTRFSWQKGLEHQSFTKTYFIKDPSYTDKRKKVCSTKKKKNTPQTEQSSTVCRRSWQPTYRTKIEKGYGLKCLSVNASADSRSGDAPASAESCYSLQFPNALHQNLLWKSVDTQRKRVIILLTNLLRR